MDEKVTADSRLPEATAFGRESVVAVPVDRGRAAAPPLRCLVALLIVPPCCLHRRRPQRPRRKRGCGKALHPGDLGVAAGWPGQVSRRTYGAGGQRGARMWRRRGCGSRGGGGTPAGVAARMQRRAG